MCVYTHEHEFRWPCMAMHSCESPCSYWDLNPGPVEEQPAPLTTEQFHQSPTPIS